MRTRTALVGMLGVLVVAGGATLAVQDAPTSTDASATTTTTDPAPSTSPAPLSDEEMTTYVGMFVVWEETAQDDRDDACTLWDHDPEQVVTIFQNSPEHVTRMFFEEVCDA